MNTLSASLIALAEILAAHRGVKLWRVGHLAANRGSFFVDLKSERRDCRTGTYARVIQWFSDNWPEGLDWPPGVPRPEPTPQLKEVA